jgi:hypothetical protein
MATGCAKRADNSMFFIGSDRVVYRVSDVPERISDHSIEERILASATANVFTFRHEGARVRLHPPGDRNPRLRLRDAGMVRVPDLTGPVDRRLGGDGR